MMGKNEGLSGWLSPIGEFHPCEYGEHSNLAYEIIDGKRSSPEIIQAHQEHYEKEKQPVISERALLEFLQWIPMGIPKWGSNPHKDYLFISYKVGITEAQKKWFESQRKSLSSTQLQMLDDALEDLEMDKALTIER